MLVALNNDTCIKSSMAHQAYKVVKNHAHEISVWTTLSRIIHARATNIGGMDGYDQSDLSTLAFKNVEQLEYFHGIIIRLQQEIILYRETISPTIIIFQYTKALPDRDKIE